MSKIPLNPPLKSGKCRVREYIFYTPRPFTSGQVVAELGICYETVKKYLQELLSEGFVKLIGTDKGRNVYVHDKRKPSTGYKVNQKHYTLESIQEAYRRQLKKRREEFDDLL